MHVDTDLDHAETLPVQSSNAAAQTRFDATTRGGVMSLHLDGAPAPHAAAAALLLDRCDALLDALDAWLHMALDWHWAGAAPADDAPHPSAGAQFSIDSDNAAAVTGRLELPWSLLRGLGAPPEALARRLQWRAVPAVLVASQPAIDETQLRLLERGGAVVLPESMRSPWHGWLRAPQESDGAGVRVELPAADCARLPDAAFTPAAAPTHGERAVCEVRLTSVGPLPPPVLAGWEGGTTIDLAPRASLWRCAGASDAERYLAGGRLLPWGDGWAMLIEST
jgi:hypothetical protein